MPNPVLARLFETVEVRCINWFIIEPTIVVSLGPEAMPNGRKALEFPNGGGIIVTPFLWQRFPA